MNTRRILLGAMASALGNDARKVARTARATGFAGLVFDVQSGMIDLAGLSQSGQREFRHLLAANEQTLIALHVDTGARGFHPSGDTDRVIARIDAAMQTAAGLGCRLVCVDAGPLPAPAHQPAPARTIRPEEAGLIIIPTVGKVEVPMVAEEEGQTRTFDAAFASHVDGALVEVGKLADRYGVTLAMRSELAMLGALERALAAANCPLFGVDLDPVGLLRDAWGIDEAFSRLGNALRHVRVRDAVVGQGRLTKPAPVGQGETDWPALLERLDEAGYSGWLTVDPAEMADRLVAAQAAGAYILSLHERT